MSVWNCSSVTYPLLMMARIKARNSISRQLKFRLWQMKQAYHSARVCCSGEGKLLQDDDGEAFWRALRIDEAMCCYLQGSHFQIVANTSRMLGLVCHSNHDCLWPSLGY